jgi:ADP-ribose pyrophosphatase YjhB (NUDIX family)
MGDTASGRATRLERYAYRAWGLLPPGVRLFVVRRATPSFHVGAICVIERADGALLLIRNSYRPRWGFPGGFLKRSESPDDAARREVREEVGVDVVLDENPKVVVEALTRRVDVIFCGHPAEESDTADPKPRSPEILEARWFPIQALPDLQDEAVAALIELGRAALPPVERG